MIRLLFFFWLLFGGFWESVRLSAQPSDSVGIIEVSPASAAEQQEHHSEHDSSPEYLFYQRQELRLINFNRQENAPLNQAYCKIDSLQAPQPGLVQHLVHGLLLRRIHALDPSAHRQEYRYWDLLEDMAYLEGLVLDSLPPSSHETLARETLAWDKLGHMMLLTRKRGFDRRRAMEFDQPTWLHLIWYDPQTKQRVSLAVFDLQDIQPWLEQLYCPWLSAQGRPTGTNAVRWLHAHMPHYPQVSLDAGQLTTLPVDRRSLDQWPDFYPAQY